MHKAAHLCFFMCMPSVPSRKTRCGRIPTSSLSGHYVPYNELLCLNLSSSIVSGHLFLLVYLFIIHLFILSFMYLHLVIHIFIHLFIHSHLGTTNTPNHTSQLGLEIR